MADRIDLDELEHNAVAASVKKLLVVVNPDEVLALVRAVRAAMALSHGNRSNPNEVTLWNVRIDNLDDFDDALEPFRKEDAR